jgi:hypothetical protein
MERRRDGETERRRERKRGDRGSWRRRMLDILCVFVDTVIRSFRSPQYLLGPLLKL